MNEDEAFIRAIVDNPGDDTPRLVYADWLDDRDDPRGPYLRAEREATVTGDIVRLRALATGLDSVWVARVSMPPVGVCIEGARITKRGPCVANADVSGAEQRTGATFSADYRAFLLNYNGGHIRREWYRFNGEMIYSDYTLGFFPLVADGASGDYPKTLDQSVTDYRRWMNNPASYVRRELDPHVVTMLSDYTRIGEIWDDTVLLGVRRPDTELGATLFDTNLLSKYFRGAGQLPEVQSFAQFIDWYLQGFGIESDVPDQYRDDLDEQLPDTGPDDFPF